MQLALGKPRVNEPEERGAFQWQDRLTLWAGFVWIGPNKALIWPDCGTPGPRGVHAAQISANADKNARKNAAFPSPNRHRRTLGCLVWVQGLID